MTALPPRAGLVVGVWPAGMPTPGGGIVDLARRVEAEGLDLFTCGDHLFGHAPSTDALMTLGVVAGATERLVLGTAVLLLALRDPVIVAKQVATLDHLAPGRVFLGVGVGGEVAQEWRAMQIPTGERAQRTDEHLELLAALWSGAEVSWTGTYRAVDGVVASPEPTTPGGPPIWIGGRSEAALRRAARHDGYCAYAMSPEGLTTRLTRIDELMGGQRPDGFRVSHVVFTHIDPSTSRARDTTRSILGDRWSTDMSRFLDSLCACGPVELVADRLAEYRAAGAQDLLFSIQAPPVDLPRQIALLAEAWEASAP